MRGLETQQPCTEGRLLVYELTHRINNEFASAISVVSLAAARSGNREIKVALTAVTERLHT
jgi:two-component sensor histidine kinase